jgi:hypothetical protein
MYNQQLNASVVRNSVETHTQPHPYTDEPTTLYTKNVNITDNLQLLKTYSENNFNLIKSLLECVNAISTTQNEIKHVLNEHTKLLIELQNGVPLLTDTLVAEKNTILKQIPPSPRSTTNSPRNVLPKTLEIVKKPTIGRPKLRNSV